MTISSCVPMGSFTSAYSFAFASFSVSANSSAPTGLSAFTGFISGYTPISTTPTSLMLSLFTSNDSIIQDMTKPLNIKKPFMIIDNTNVKIHTKDTI